MTGEIISKWRRKKARPACSETSMPNFFGRANGADDIETARTQVMDIDALHNSQEYQACDSATKVPLPTIGLSGEPEDSCYDEGEQDAIVQDDNIAVFSDSESVEILQNVQKKQTVSFVSKKT